MNDNDFKVKVIFEGKEYIFESVSEAYIFHIGIHNDIHIDYGTDDLLTYIQYVQNCYLDDINHTPLCAFADYVAENWESVKKSGYRDMMQLFYAQED